MLIADYYDGHIAHEDKFEAFRGEAKRNAIDAVWREIRTIAGVMRPSHTFLYSVAVKRFARKEIDNDWNAEQGLFMVNLCVKDQFYTAYMTYDRPIQWPQGTGYGQPRIYTRLFAYNVTMNNGKPVYTYYRYDLAVGKLLTAPITEADLRTEICLPGE